MNDETNTKGEGLLDVEIVRDASKERPMARRMSRKAILLLRILRQSLRRRARYEKYRGRDLSMVKAPCLCFDFSLETVFEILITDNDG